MPESPCRFAPGETVYVISAWPLFRVIVKTRIIAVEECATEPHYLVCISGHTYRPPPGDETVPESQVFADLDEAVIGVSELVDHLIDKRMQSIRVLREYEAELLDDADAAVREVVVPDNTFERTS